MSVAVDTSVAHNAVTSLPPTESFSETAPLSPTESMETATSATSGYRCRSPKPCSESSPSPTEGSSLHRVADMLKEKLDKDADSSCRSVHDSNNISGMDSSSCGMHAQSEASKAFHNLPREIMSSAGKPAIHANGCNSSESEADSYAAILMRHHMGRLGTDPISGDPSTVLKGILEGKERMAHENVTGDLSLSNGQAESKAVAQLLQHDRGEDDGLLTKDDGYDNDSDDLDSFPSGSPGEMMMSDQDSDQENNLNSANSSSSSSAMQSLGEGSKIYGTSLLDRSRDEFSDASEFQDSLEAKRARVETIISSMNSGRPGLDGNGNLERRQKRKQYIPQQHDSKVCDDTDQPPNKARKLEKHFLQKQLKQMQEQLAVMQQRYSELFTQEPSDQMDMREFTESLMMGRKSPPASHTDDSPSKPLKPSTQANDSSLQRPTVETDPRLLFKQASKLIEEQEVATKCHQHQQVSPIAGENAPPADLQNLAKILKDELTTSVGTLVDNVVAKFVQKHKKKDSVKEKLPVPLPPTSVRSETKPANTSPSRTPVSTPVKLSPGSRGHSENNNLPPKPPRTKVTDKITHPLFDAHPKPFADFMRNHAALFPPPYYPATQVPPTLPPMFPQKEPEQTEALALVVSTPKKKRTKVTDTRLSPRAARALLQETMAHHHSPQGMESVKHHIHQLMVGDSPYPPPLVPASLPTSVAIPNPSLQHADMMAMYSHAAEHNPFLESCMGRRMHSPSISPNMAHTPDNNLSLSMKSDMDCSYEQMMNDSVNYDNNGMHMTTTLTPMHLRKAKLMFFFVRYPSSSILKVYFPDVKFNKNNTAQLVKWFSNFREFFYIQMEKYARQAVAEGMKNPEDLVINIDHELYRVLNLHYNRNNQIEVPVKFVGVVENTLREFFKSVYNVKDVEQSWKKAIYKVIARMDDTLPEYFKSPNWMEQLSDG